METEPSQNEPLQSETPPKWYRKWENYLYGIYASGLFSIVFVDSVQEPLAAIILWDLVPGGLILFFLFWTTFFLKLLKKRTPARDKAGILSLYGVRLSALLGIVYYILNPGIRLEPDYVAGTVIAPVIVLVLSLLCEYFWRKGQKSPPLSPFASGSNADNP